jgi:hypothetical protein
MRQSSDFSKIRIAKNGNQLFAILEVEIERIMMAVQLLNILFLLVLRTFICRIWLDFDHFLELQFKGFLDLKMWELFLRNLLGKFKFYAVQKEI